MSETYDRLLSLYRRDGKLTVDNTLADATDPASPLHPRFEWDDTIAGHEYRRIQARDLIQSFRVTVETPESELVRVRAFVHEPEVSSYAPVGDVMDDHERRTQLLERMKRDMLVFRKRLVNYSEFTGVVVAIDEALEGAGDTP